MKPGDLIEWVYTYNEKPVLLDEMLWSSVLERRVPIGGVALLVALYDGKMIWFSDKGLFRAREDDIMTHNRQSLGAAMRTRVVVREYEESF